MTTKRKNFIVTQLNEHRIDPKLDRTKPDPRWTRDHSTTARGHKFRAPPGEDCPRCSHNELAHDSMGCLIQDCDCREKA